MGSEDTRDEVLKQVNYILNMTGSLKVRPGIEYNFEGVSRNENGEIVATYREERVRSDPGGAC